jgi:NADPH:quinone reductase-like Zn-dependent oxidoreductase
MIAATYTSPNHLTLTTVNKRTRNNGELLVKVEAAGINPTDIKHLMSGMLPYSGTKATQAKPIGFGSEGSGVVVAIPEAGETSANDQPAFQVGDQIYFLVDRMNQPQEQGSVSEFVSVRPTHAAVVPPSLSMVRAAATPLALLTAYQALRMQGYATKGCGVGKRILITGASGGVGHFAVQLAKKVYTFDTVVAVCSKENAQFVQDLGADEVVDYKTENFATKYSSNKFDVGFDLVGGDPMCCSPCDCCAARDPLGHTIQQVRKVTKNSGAIVGLMTGASFAGPCGTLCGICCSCLPGLCLYKCSCCGPKYSSYFLPRGHIGKTNVDLNVLGEWIEEGLIAPEVSYEVGMNDVRSGIARMDKPYRAFNNGSSTYDATPGESNTPHRGKVVVRMTSEESSENETTDDGSSSSSTKHKGE